MEKSTADDITTEGATETSLERNGVKQEGEDFEEALSPPISIQVLEEAEVEVWSKACQNLKGSMQYCGFWGVQL